MNEPKERTVEGMAKTKPFSLVKRPKKLKTSGNSIPT